jgi:UPF0755 protein
VIRGLTVATLAIVVAFTAFVGWLLLVYPSTEGPGAGAEVEVVLADFEDADALVALLDDEALVADASIFGAYLRLHGADARLRRGRVQLDDGMTPEEIAGTVAIGFGGSKSRITFPEGLDRYAIAERLADYGICPAEDFLAATEDRDLLDSLDIEGPTAEGYLFPDTYELFTDTDASEVVELMVSTFHRRVDPHFEEHEDAFEALEEGLGWGELEVLTLASIVEKEAAVAEERPRIAGVFLNRLRSEDFRPHRLQADPTVSYGYLVAPDSSEPCRAYEGGAPSAAMVRDRDNAYNTYLIEGLPPGPIANPGADAVRSVLTAEDHDFFFFVARGGGRHHFSRTLEEHDGAVERYLR